MGFVKLKAQFFLTIFPIFKRKSKKKNYSKKTNFSNFRKNTRQRFYQSIKKIQRNLPFDYLVHNFHRCLNFYQRLKLFVADNLKVNRHPRTVT